MAGTHLVVPFYNEARRFDAPRFAAFLEESPATRLVLVDDGSTDATRSLLEALCDSAPGRAELVVLAANRGKAEAIRAGVQRALEHAPARIGYWDADLSTPLDALHRFEEILAERPEIEIVQGARVQLLGRRIVRSALRHYAGRVGATAISHVLGLQVYDTQCGAKLFRGSELARSLFDEPFIGRWLVDVEVLARFVRLREARGGVPAEQAIYEYPLEAWRSMPGSKVGPLDYLRSARDLIRIQRRYSASRRTAGS